MRNVLILCLIAFLAGCASAQTKNARPDWVDGKTEALYPAKKFRVAVGSGPSRESAIEDAKKQLAAGFLEKVESQSSSEHKSDFSENTSGQQSGGADRSSRTVTQRSASILLRGSQVVEYYQDSSGTVYALAVLDQLKVRNSYSTDLNRLAEKLHELHETFQSQPEQKTGQEILAQAASYADLAREAATIGAPMPLGDPLSQRELQAVRSKLEELKSSRAIGLELNAQGAEGGQQAEELRSLIENCLQGKGYGIAAPAAKPNVSFKGAYAAKSRPTKTDGYSRFQFSVTATLTHDKRTERVFTPEESSGAHLDQAFDNIKGSFSEAICSAILKVL